MTKLDKIGRRYFPRKIFYWASFFKRAILAEPWRPAKGSLFTESFREYYYSTSNDVIDRELRSLKESLDKKSKDVIQRVWERYCRQIPISEYSQNYLESGDFYTLREKSESERVYSEMQKIKKNLKIQGHVDPSSFCYDCGLVFVPHIKSYLKNKKILDVGAYNGDSILALDKYLASEIIAYEPSKKNLEQLKKTLNKNEHKTPVKIISKAVGNKNTEVNLSGEGSTANIKKGKGVQQVRIDDENIKKVGFIKLDVEGYERQVLEGALATIKRDRPVLSVSIYHHPKQFLSTKIYLQKTLKKYNFVIRKLNPAHPVYETTLIGYPKHLKS